MKRGHPDDYSSDHRKGTHRVSDGSPNSPPSRYDSRKHDRYDSWSHKRRYSRHNSPRRYRYSRRGDSSSSSFSRSPSRNYRRHTIPAQSNDRSKQSSSSQNTKQTTDGRGWFQKSRFSGDVRPNDPLYGKRHPNTLEIIRFSKTLDNTLDSPPLDFSVGWSDLTQNSGTFQSPLERVNKLLACPRPDTCSEWWLKGTLVLMVLGIPRTWEPRRILFHLVEAHQKELDPTASPRLSRDDFSTLSKQLGICKFILQFGEQDNAINKLPTSYPKIGDDRMNGLEPEGMGLLVFESESKALDFWSTLGHVAITAYPYSMRICPDPSGWRIYAEALATFCSLEDDLDYGMLGGMLKNEASMDLLSVLTSKPTANVPQNAEKKPAIPTYITPFVSQEQQAQDIQQQLSKIGIRGMYHGPSKMMSIHFPTVKVLQTHMVGARVFIAPTGARVNACFLKLPDNKYIPIVRRNNLEHMSNVQGKLKEEKLLKFQPPTVGIITLNDL
ncbi:hypothetical protein BdWA1_000386 [Babesia duncani]|uniref:Uncharacterized protein n=1 Tax=Babesia duncani TaxID=323732 RepID=A0AAD9PN01_9APIC|nr:hypothetical protein BdWA1_000386 [Babesia duncani]